MNEKNKILEIALNEVGYMEKATNRELDDKTANAGRNNYTKYARDLDNLGDFYNGKKNGFPWCDVFVDWCFVKALGKERAMELLNQPLYSTGAGTGFSLNFYKQNGLFGENAEIGDQIFFKNSSGICHTGLVYGVDNRYVYTVEGNTRESNNVISNGGKVCKKKYLLNSDYIAGYGKPKYNNSIVDKSEIIEERK